MKVHSNMRKRNLKKKAAVIFSSGIGNAIMMVPLLKMIKKADFHICIFQASEFLDIEFLTCNDFPHDEIIDLNENMFSLIAFKYFQKFDFAYLDYSSSSVQNIIFSRIISREVIAYREKRFPLPNLKYRLEKQDLHSAIMNMQLFDPDLIREDFDLEMMHLKYQESNKPDTIKKIEASGKIPVFVQPSSSNMTAKYKNWPVSYWKELLIRIHAKYPDLVFILSGDENETEIGASLDQAEYESVNLTGKTSLAEACALLFYSKIYIGLDSGFMHLAAAYNIPSFSIFGASSFFLFGYQQFNPDFHRTIVNSINCWPCLGYKNKNISRVKNPADCPDQKCITELKPSVVFANFNGYLPKVLPNVSRT